MATQQTIKTTNKAKSVAKKLARLQDTSKCGTQHIDWPDNLKWIDDVSANDEELTLYSNLAEAGDIRDFKERIHTIIRGLGFSDFGFVHGKCHGNELPLITNPREHIDTYTDFGCYEYDLLEQYRENHTKPAFSSWLYKPAIDALYDTDIFRTNRQIVEISESFGYFDHYYVCMKSVHLDECIMLIISRQGEESIRFKRHVYPHKRTLRLLCQVIDYLCITKFPSHFLDLEKNEVITITPQPLRVLSALANNDKTITQLADKLCISSVTVHHHITTARKALGTRTNIGAIKKAIKLGLITFE